MSEVRLPGKKIIGCVEVVEGRERAPALLRELGADRVVGRRVLAWSSSLGSYGMGGPGFFGLRLAASGDFPVEWLVLRLWGAGDWLLLDGRWLEAHPNQYEAQTPLFSNYEGGLQWDLVSSRLNGTVIACVDLEHDRSRLVLVAGDETHLLEIPADPARLPRYGGTMEPHAWPSDEDQRDAWLVVQGDLVL